MKICFKAIYYDSCNNEYVEEYFEYLGNSLGEAWSNVIENIEIIKDNMFFIAVSLSSIEGGE